MNGWPIPSAPSAHVQAAALRAAFLGYIVNVLAPWLAPAIRGSGQGYQPRLYCLISLDAREIWRELRGQ